MNNRIATMVEHQSSARSRWFTQRSQAAAVLLSGWFFFWVVGIAQPCCMAFAGPHDDDHAMSQSMSADEHAHPADLAGSTSHQNEECPLAFTADAPLPSQTSWIPATTNYTPHLVVVVYFAPPATVADFSNPFDLYHPSPPPRIYLRTQRLRI